MLDSLCNIISEQTGQLFNSSKLAHIYNNVKNTNIDKKQLNII